MTNHPTFGKTFFDTLLITAFVIGNFAVVAYVALKPKNPADGVAVVFSPWLGAKEAFERATSSGDRFVRYGNYPFIVVVMPGDANYLARLRAEGALLVLDPKALAACLGSAGGNRQTI